jgi:hypothetical protein
VDLGERRHRHQSTEALGRMAAQILYTVWSRLHRRGLVAHPVPPAGTLVEDPARLASADLVDPEHRDRLGLDR